MPRVGPRALRTNSGFQTDHSAFQTNRRTPKPTLPLVFVLHGGLQLRDSLFKESVAGGRSLREKAVDTALELARSAPLDMQGRVRRGAGRIDSLLGGECPQPVSTGRG